MDFWWSIPQKWFSIGHFGAKDHWTIRISKYFDVWFGCLFQLLKQNTVIILLDGHEVEWFHLVILWSIHLLDQVLRWQRVCYWWILCCEHIWECSMILVKSSWWKIISQIFEYVYIILENFSLWGFFPFEEKSLRTNHTWKSFTLHHPSLKKRKMFYPLLGHLLDTQYTTGWDFFCLIFEKNSYKARIHKPSLVL